MNLSEEFQKRMFRGHHINKKARQTVILNKGGLQSQALDVGEFMVDKDGWLTKEEDDKNEVASCLIYLSSQSEELNIVSPKIQKVEFKETEIFITLVSGEELCIETEDKSLLEKLRVLSD